jgi:hypothetical protein
VNASAARSSAVWLGLAAALAAALALVAAPATLAAAEHGDTGSDKQKLRLVVHPGTVNAGELADFSIKTRVRHPKKAPIGFVRVRFAGQSFHTNQRGHAHVDATFAHPGKRRARARLEGYKRAVAVVRVTP